MNVRGRYRWLTRNWNLNRATAQAVRDQLVRRLIRHCYTNVPYYRDLMDSLRLSAESVRTAGRAQ